MIKYPDTFQSALPAGFDGKFHWDFLLRAFAGTRIAPMDIDAMVERNGYFLFFETKDPGVPIPKGQRDALSRLVATTPSHLILCAKHPRDVRGWLVWTRDPKGALDLQRTRHDGTADDLVKWVTDWFRSVNRLPFNLPPVYRDSKTPQPDLFRDLVTDQKQVLLHLIDQLPDKDLVDLIGRYV